MASQVTVLPWSYFWGGCSAGTRCALACCRCICTSARRGPFWRCRSYRPNVSSRLSASRSSRSPPPSFVHLPSAAEKPYCNTEKYRKHGQFPSITDTSHRLAFYSRDRIRSISLITRFNHRESRWTGGMGGGGEGGIKLSAMETTKTARMRMSPSINFQLTQHRDNVESFDINKSSTVGDAISNSGDVFPP